MELTAREFELLAYLLRHQGQVVSRQMITPGVEDRTVWLTLMRGVIAGVVVIAVAEVSKRHPRIGALLLTLPLVSILAFIPSWHENRDIAAISRLARETLVLVPLGLPFFVPFALAPRLGLGF